MVKRRPVVVVSPRYRRRTGLCLVAPLSTVAPDDPEPCHYRIPAGRCEFLHSTQPSWVKADMLTCVAFHRLDRLVLRGSYLAPVLDSPDLVGIRGAVLSALGFRSGLTQPSDEVT